MTTTKKLASAIEKSADAKPSPDKKNRASAACKVTPLDPATPLGLEDARREILRLVYQSSVAITQALIEDALERKYLSAKFLFELAGLSTMKPDDLESPALRETFESMLLEHFQVAVPKAADHDVAGESVAGQGVTEVAEITLDTPPVAEAPVEL